MISCFPQYQIIGSRLCTIIYTLRGHALISSGPIYSGRELRVFKQLDVKLELFEHLFEHVGFERPLIDINCLYCISPSVLLHKLSVRIAWVQMFA